MTTDPIVAQGRQRQLTALAAFTALGAVVAAPFVAFPENPQSQEALTDYLGHAEVRLFIAWLLSLLAAVAWLCLAVGWRRMLPASGGRDLWVVGLTAGQAVGCAGAALDVAAVPTEARDVSLPVYNAFANAGHSAGVAASVFAGLALIGLARAVRAARMPRWFSRCTLVAGIALLPAGLGPVSWGLTVVWLGVAGAVLLRSPSRPTREVPESPTGARFGGTIRRG
jgi:hypothetical protein